MILCLVCGGCDEMATYSPSARFSPDVPICLVGQSAGGHLALMVAANRSDVASAIFSSVWHASWLRSTELQTAV